MAELAGHSEILGVLELRRSQQLIEDIQRAALMGDYLGIFWVCIFVAEPDRNDLDRQCADVDAYVMTWQLGSADLR
ncbi:MAG: hypothetical protein ACLP07_13385 [Terracidiphilus sp.]